MGFNGKKVVLIRSAFLFPCLLTLPSLYCFLQFPMFPIASSAVLKHFHLCFPQYSGAGKALLSPTSTYDTQENHFYTDHVDCHLLR